MLIYIGMNIFWTFQGTNEVCIHLESFASALGHIYVYAISTLFKYNTVNSLLIIRIENYFIYKVLFKKLDFYIKYI